MSYVTGPEPVAELEGILDMFSKKKKKKKKLKAKKKTDEYVEKLTTVAERMEAAKALPAPPAPSTALVVSGTGGASNPALNLGLIGAAALLGWYLWSKS